MLETIRRRIVGRGRGFGALEIFLELFHLWALSNDGKSCVWHLFQNVTDILDSLFAAKTSNVNHQKVVGISVGHDLSHFVIFEFGVETLRIDTLAPDFDTRNSIFFEFFLHRWRCTESQIGSGVGKTQEFPCQFLDTGNETKVVAGVHRKVGVIAHDQGNGHGTGIEN